MDGQNYLIVSIAGYTEEVLENTSPEFIASILRGHAGFKKAEVEHAKTG